MAAGSRGATTVEEVRVEELEAADIVEVEVNIAGLSGGTDEAEGEKAGFSSLPGPKPKLPPPLPLPLPLPPPPPAPVLLNFLRKGLLELREAISGGEGGGGRGSKPGFHIYRSQVDSIHEEECIYKKRGHRQGTDRGRQ